MLPYLSQTERIDSAVIVWEQVLCLHMREFWVIEGAIMTFQ